MANITRTLKGLKFKLVRMDNSFPKVKGWNILTEDGQTRLAVTFQVKTLFLNKQFGYRQVKESYWICESFRFHDVWIGRTLTEVLINLNRLLTPKEMHKQLPLRRTLQ